MSEISNNTNILYHYLTMLPVKVSKLTISRLLNNPVGDSLRGMSDVMDTLHIKNAVYQLPSREYFSKLDTPYITMLHRDQKPFCVVTKNNNSIISFIDGKGKKHKIEENEFLRQWTGTVLIGESDINTISDPLYIFKNIIHFLYQYILLIAVFLIIGLSLFLRLQQIYLPNLFSYLSILILGIIVSLAIIYKEEFNEDFLERFCKIGETVNCNQVLHSKGASIAGIGLGQLSLLYFSTIFLYSILCIDNFYFISVICCSAAIGFTLYSIIYQVFILHKGCLLCMVINFIIWGNAVLLYLLRNNFSLNYSLNSLFIFAAIGCILLIIGILFNSYNNKRKENFQLKTNLATLFKPITFKRLLELEPHIKEMPALDIVLKNKLSGENRLLIITNPNCKNCQRVHHYMNELSDSTPISLLFLTFPNDNIGNRVVEMVIESYRQGGWEKAMELLDKWFDKFTIKEIDKYKVTIESQEIRKQQQLYCWNENINQTPLIFINGYKLPEVYSISNLKYVIT